MTLANSPENAPQAAPEEGSLVLQPGYLNEQHLEPTDNAIFTIPFQNAYNAKVSNVHAQVTLAGSPANITITGVTITLPFNAAVLLPGATGQIQVGIATTGANPASYPLNVTMTYDLAPSGLVPPTTGDPGVVVVSPD